MSWNFEFKILAQTLYEQISKRNLKGFLNILFGYCAFFFLFVFDWDGDHCEKNECQNDAECITVSEGYFCKCKKGFAGEHCELGNRKEFFLNIF